VGHAGRDLLDVGLVEGLAEAAEQVVDGVGHFSSSDQLGAYPLGASCITASVWPSGSSKKAIQRSWSSILAMRCGLESNTTPRLASSATVSAISAQRK